MKTLSSFVALSLIFAKAASAQSVQPVQAIAVPLKTGSLSLKKRELVSIRRHPLVKSTRLVFNSAEAAGLRELKDPSLAESSLLTFSSESTLESFKAWARTHTPHIRIEGNPVAKTMDATKPAGESDPLRFLQWGLQNSGEPYSVQIDDFTSKQIPGTAKEDIRLEGVPAATVPITVAVLDSGIDVNHPDLKGAIVRHEAECKALDQYKQCLLKQPKAKCEAEFAVDHDGNGYPLDCTGWNLAPEDNGDGFASSGPLPQMAGILGNTNVKDFVGHGTHVAGIIAAQYNGEGIEGVAPQAKILPVRVISGEPSERIRAQSLSASSESSTLPEPQEAKLGSVGRGMGDIVARGVLYAIRSGVNIINLSLGYPDPLDSELLRRLLKTAQDKGIVIVAAAGNDSTDSVIFPCRYDGVICVGAHTPDGTLAFFSNHGYGVDLLAPGWNILSTIPTALMPMNFTDQEGYDTKDGTSMATPFVSGMMARMLGVGMSPDEAYARLLLGARQTRPSQLETLPFFLSSSSLSGNADLASSFKVSPQPLVVPAHKDPIRIEWDRFSRTVPIRFELANHWVEAGSTTVTIVSQDPQAKLAQGSWKLASWKAGETQSFVTQLQITDSQLNSDLDFKVRVVTSKSQPREFTLRAEVVSIIQPSSHEADLKVEPIVSSDGTPLSRKYGEIQTVSTDFDSAHEYLGILQTSGTSRTLDLLVESADGKLVVQGSLTQTKPADTALNSVSSLRKIKDPSTGKPIYVLIEMQPAKSGQMGQSQLTWLDPSLKPIAGHPVQVVEKMTTFLTEDFQWQQRSGEWVPTWFALGRIPPLEAKPYDPWKPGTNVNPDFHLYLLARDGLHTITLPTEYPLMVSLVPQTVAQKQSGTVSVLLAKGKDYALEYATAELVEGTWKNITPITQPSYHNFRGIIPSPVFSLNSNAPLAGYSFSGFVGAEVGPGGGLRATLVPFDGARATMDFVGAPIRNFDAITDIPGIFAGLSRQAMFSLTKYEIQLHDFSRNQSAMTSLKRFSFMPNTLAVKSVFPLLVQDHKLLRATGETRVPALFTPGDFIFSKATQVIAPRFDANGNVIALKRPARFHLESKNGCTALPTPRAFDRSSPSELLFFCGDRMIAVPLSY
jgi:subtilisin family serine protease